MLIKSIDFQVDLQHQEGSKMHLSDAISRFNTHDSDNARDNAVQIKDFNISIHKVEDITGFKYITMKQIERETATDVQLEELKKYIIKAFLSLNMNALSQLMIFMITESPCHQWFDLKDKCIVIPTSLMDDAISTLHRSHMGIVKTKENASNCMFWPRIYSSIEKFLSTCRVHMMHKIKQSPEPLEHDILSSP